MSTTSIKWKLKGFWQDYLAELLEIKTIAWILFVIFTIMGGWLILTILLTKFFEKYPLWNYFTYSYTSTLLLLLGLFHWHYSIMFYFMAGTLGCLLSFYLSTCSSCWFFSSGKIKS